jgi:hypothetical protein
MRASKAPLFDLLVDLVRRPWVDDDEAALDAELYENEWLSAAELAARGEARLRRLVWRAFLDGAGRAAWHGLDAGRILVEPPAALLATLPRAEGGEILDADLEADEARRRAAFARRANRWGGELIEDARIGVIAAPCAVSAPAVHVFVDHVLVESSRPSPSPDGARKGESSWPSPSPDGARKGESSRPPPDGAQLVASDLDSFAAPRLRQPLAIRGHFLARGCPCGRALPLLVPA